MAMSSPLLTPKRYANIRGILNLDRKEELILNNMRGNLVEFLHELDAFLTPAGRPQQLQMQQLASAVGKVRQNAMNLLREIINAIRTDEKYEAYFKVAEPIAGFETAIQLDDARIRNSFGLLETAIHNLTDEIEHLQKFALRPSLNKLYDKFIRLKNEEKVEITISREIMAQLKELEGPLRLTLKRKEGFWSR